MWPPSVEWEGEGQSTDVLKIPGSRSNINAYVLKLVDIVFGREGLEKIETKQVPNSEGYLFIKGEPFQCDQVLQMSMTKEQTFYSI